MFNQYKITSSIKYIYFLDLKNIMNLKNVTTLLASKFKDLPSTPVTNREQEFADEFEITLRSGAVTNVIDDLEFENE